MDSISYLLWIHYGGNLKKHCQRYMRWVLEQVYFSAAVESIFKHNKEWREFFIKVSLNYSSETGSCSLPSGTELQSPGVSPHFCEPSFPTSVSLSPFSAGKSTHTQIHIHTLAEHLCGEYYTWSCNTVSFINLSRVGAVLKLTQVRSELSQCISAHIKHLLSNASWAPLGFLILLCFFLVTELTLNC